jgi:hypothetical protein
MTPGEDRRAGALISNSVLKKALVWLFDVLASLKLAIFLLVTLAVTLAAGTILESLHGAKAAQQLIYFTSGFSLLLGLLAINVAFAALNRLPFSSSLRDPGSRKFSRSRGRSSCKRAKSLKR